MEASAEIETMCRHIREAADPEHALFEAIHALQDRGDFKTMAAVFEAAFVERPILNYWTFYAVMNAYAALGEARAAFLVASMADRIHSSGSGAPRVASILYDHFLGHGDAIAAAKVFERHLLAFGETVWNADCAEMSRRLGADTSECDARRAGRLDVRVVPSSVRPAWAPERVLGGAIPDELMRLAQPWGRPDISVSMLPDAELVVHRGHFVARDRQGRPHGDLSVTTSAPLSLWYRDRAPEAFTVHEAADVVMISDQWWYPNICHFLLDHTVRLELYRRAGVDIASALVVGPDMAQAFQRDIVAALGIGGYVGVTAPAVVRARRLWVSSDCVQHIPSAHGGAQWALDAVRRTFGRPAANRTRRLHISRRDSGRRRLVNERAVAALLGRHGFETIALGELSFGEQVRAFEEATHVFGPHGAGMALSVFCAPETCIAEVFHPFYSNLQIAMQAQPLALRYTAIAGADPAIANDQMADPRAREHLRLSKSWQYSDVAVDLGAVEAWLAGVGLAVVGLAGVGPAPA